MCDNNTTQQCGECEACCSDDLPVNQVSVFENRMSDFSLPPTLRCQAMNIDEEMTKMLELERRATRAPASRERKCDR